MKLATQIATLLLASAAAMPAFAADSASSSATATASTKIIRPIAVSSSQNIEFGTIVKPATGDASIAVSTSGVRSLGTAAAAAGATPTQAIFSVSGEGATAITVTVDSSFDMVNSLDSSKKLTVTTSADKTGSQTLSGTLGSAGSLTVNVGGGFTLGATAATGDYSGSFTVAANYQ